MNDFHQLGEAVGEAWLRQGREEELAAPGLFGQPDSTMHQPLVREQRDGSARCYARSIFSPLGVT